MSVGLILDNPRLLALGGIFRAEGMQARLVGGAVRDMIIGRSPKDLDLATDATPDESIAIAEAAGCRVIPTGLGHGTVTIVVDGEHFEVTSLRRDVETDGRHAKVEFVRDFRTDASRRDFTINAMSASLSGEVFDYFGGMDDLRVGRVRFVGDARRRIEEDYLRILRFFRFRTRFNGSNPDLDAVAAIAVLHPGLAGISGERVWQEMGRVLSSSNGWREVGEMARLGVLGSIGIRGVTSGQVMNAEAVRANGGGPALCLGALLADGGKVSAIADLWRISNRERQDALLAAEIVRSGDHSPSAWLGRAVDGMDAEAAAVVLAATNRTDAARELLSGIPTFPVHGRDVVDAGVEPGPAVGRLLGEMRAAWKSSGFRLEAEQLMEVVGLAAPPSRSLARR